MLSTEARGRPEAPESPRRTPEPEDEGEEILPGGIVYVPADSGRQTANPLCWSTGGARPLAVPPLQMELVKFGEDEEEEEEEEEDEESGIIYCEDGLDEETLLPLQDALEGRARAADAADGEVARVGVITGFPSLASSEAYLQRAVHGKLPGRHMQGFAMPAPLPPEGAADVYKQPGQAQA